MLLRGNLQILGKLEGRQTVHIFVQLSRLPRIITQASSITLLLHHISKVHNCTVFVKCLCDQREATAQNVQIKTNVIIRKVCGISCRNNIKHMNWSRGS